MAMTIDALIKAAENHVVTPESVAKLNERLDKAEAKFVEEARAKRITEEWLNREYTI